MKNISPKIYLIISLLILALISAIFAGLYFYPKYKQQKTDLILSELGIKDIITLLPLGSEVEIFAEHKNQGLLLTINHLKLNSEVAVSTEEIVTIFKKYTPYTDIYYHPWESLQATGAKDLNLSLQINIKYNQEEKVAFSYININEPFIGNIQIRLKVDNIDENTLIYLKKLINIRSFNEIYKEIKISSIAFTYTPAKFMENYKKVMAFNQSTPAKNNDRFLTLYREQQKKLGLDNEKIANNMREINFFLENPKQINGRIAFAPPAELNSLLSLLPAASLSRDGN